MCSRSTFICSLLSRCLDSNPYDSFYSIPSNKNRFRPIVPVIPIVPIFTPFFQSHPIFFFLSSIDLIHRTFSYVSFFPLLLSRRSYFPVINCRLSNFYLSIIIYIFFSFVNSSRFSRLSSIPSSVLSNGTCQLLFSFPDFLTIIFLMFHLSLHFFLYVSSFVLLFFPTIDTLTLILSCSPKFF